MQNGYCPTCGSRVALEGEGLSEVQQSHSRDPRSCSHSATSAKNATGRNEHTHSTLEAMLTRQAPPFIHLSAWKGNSTNFA